MTVSQASYATSLTSHQQLAPDVFPSFEPDLCFYRNYATESERWILILKTVRTGILLHLLPFLPTLTTLYLINVPGRGCCRYPQRRACQDGRRMYGKTLYIPKPEGLGTPPLTSFLVESDRVILRNRIDRGPL